MCVADEVTFRSNIHSNVPSKLDNEKDGIQQQKVDAAKDFYGGSFVSSYEDDDCDATAIMETFSRQQKDTCPIRFKELYHLGTQHLLLKRTQAYMKELQESKKVIRFEMSLQKRKEKKKMMYRQSMRQQESCCERLYSRSFSKQKEARQRIQKIAKAKEQESKSFNIYAAFRNEYIY